MGLVLIDLPRNIELETSNIYVVLHFEHKNDVIIIVKHLYRAMICRRVAL